MKRMTYLLPALLMAGVFTCTEAMAQERSANGAQDVQSTWAALKSLTSKAISKADAADSKIITLTSNVTTLEGRVNAMDSRITNVEGAIGLHETRLGVIDTTLRGMDTDIMNLTAELGQLREDYMVLNWQVSKIIQCSISKSFFNGVSKCKSDGADVDVGTQTKVTKTFSVGNNECGDQRCAPTGPTAQKICERNGFTDVKGTPNVTSYFVPCGQIFTSKRWSANNSSWDFVYASYLRFGDNGCYGNQPTASYITSVSCYKFQ